MYERYAEIRDRLGLTDYAVAKKAGIGRATLSEWKSGTYKPKHDKLVKIAAVLGVSVEEMTGEAPQKFAVVPEFNEFEKALVYAYRKADAPIQIAIDRLLNIEDVKKEAVFTA